MKKLRYVGMTVILLMTSFLFTQGKETMTTNNPIIQIQTTLGSFDIELFVDKAPKTCENFMKLAEKGYYNQTHFHRIIPSFMIQGGDPEGNGTGGESIFGKTFADEFHPSLTFNSQGLLAMANRGPNTNGSQFFITTALTPWLTNKHTIFGKVVKGYDVIQKIESTGSQSGKPQVKTQITAVTLSAQ